MATRSRRVVFLIDSNEERRVTHETILRNEGYEILSAADGARALGQMHEQAPDLVLMAHKIGASSAAQLIRVVKGDRDLQGVKVAVYGNAHDAALLEESMGAGAHAYIALPIAPQQLVREVVQLIGRA